MTDILITPSGSKSTAEPSAAQTAAQARDAHFVNGEDQEMIRTAAQLTRDINKARPAVYWTDMLLTALLGYATMAGAMFLQPWWLALASAVISVFALYRAGSFIHELTHIRRRDLPGFHRAWNIIVGMPALLPSFMYEGIHSIHHQKAKFGTIEDPEYLPLASMKPWSVPMFVVAAAFAPIALLFRWAVLSPLTLLIPPLRRFVRERYSGLIINPAFRRKAPTGELRTAWIQQEVLLSLWSIAIITLTATGIIPLRIFAIYIGILSVSIVTNQIRTLVAHLWEGDGEPMTVTGQFLDSVNVPPPSTLPFLWAPVGLRYHALHHLLPGVPYHSLGEAHRRLSEALPEESAYHRSNHPGLSKLTISLIAGTRRPTAS